MMTRHKPLALLLLLLAASMAAGIAQTVLSVKLGTTNIPIGGTADYGQTEVGTNLTHTFTVTNIGSSTISGITTSVSSNIFDPGHFEVENNQLSNLGVGQSKTFDLEFHADEVGSVSNEIRLFVNGTANFNFFAVAESIPIQPPPPAELRVEHNGTFVPEDSQFNFGSTNPGQDIVKTFTVTNEGDEDVSIGPLGLGINGGSNNSYSYDGSSGLSDIPPGGSGSYTLRFESVEVGSLQAQVRLFVNGTAQYEYWVNATVNPPPAPDIRVTQGSTTINHNGSINIGSTPFGTDLQRTFTIHNDGDADMNVSNINWDGTEITLVGTQPTSVPDGGSRTFTLKFAGDTAGQHSPEVRIHSDDPDTPIFRYDVVWTVGNPIGPVLRVVQGSNTITQGETINFGTTGVGQTLTRTFTAYNDGDQNLTISTISIGFNGSDPARFLVDENNVSNVPPDGSATFRLKFDAAGIGTVTDEIDLFVGGISRLEFFCTGTVAPPDFSVNVAPSSRTLNPGQNTTYTVQTQALYGFSGSLNLSLSGLPSNTTASFSPQSVNAGSNATLTVNTTASTPLGGRTLTISASNGGVTRSDTANLTVQSASDFSLTVTPGSRTVNQGGETTYTVEAVRTGGFSEPINLTITGRPPNATHNYSPSTIAVGQTSTLTVDTGATTPVDTYSMNVRGTAGSLVRNRSATLVVNEANVLEPDIASLSPQRIQLGTVSTIVVTGSNFQSSTVSIPESEDPSQVEPVLVSANINAAGTRIDAVIDATNPNSEGIFLLVVENGGGVDAKDFRVAPNTPIVDLWTPSEVVRNASFSLFMLGSNLQGATLSATHSGVSFDNVANGDDSRLTAIMHLDDTVFSNFRVVVRKGGSTLYLDVDVVTPSGFTRNTRDLVDTENRQLRSEFPLRPVYMQEFTPVGILANKGELGGMQGKRAQADPDHQHDKRCLLTFRYPIVAFDYVYPILINEFGDADSQILNALGLGEVLRFGTITITAFAYVELRFTLDFCGFGYYNFCIIGTEGFEIPLVQSLIHQFSWCTYGGFSQFLQAEGIFNTFNYNTPGQCTEINQLTTPADGGFQYAEIVKTDCCTEPVTATASGTNFIGTGFQRNWGGTANLGNATPDPAACAMCQHVGTRNNGSLMNAENLPHRATGTVVQDTTIYLSDSHSYYYFAGTSTVDSDNYSCMPFHDDLAAAADIWSATHSPGLVGYGDISLQNGGNFQPHNNHQNGLDVDARYIRTDREPINFTFNFHAIGQFDAAATLALINRFVAQGATRVIVSHLARAHLQAVPGGNIPAQIHYDNGTDHHNHMHVEFPQ